MSIVLRTLERLGRWGAYQRGMESRWWETPVGRVHGFYAKGQGTLPPMVLLHGLGSSALSYAPMLQQLLPHVQEVYAIDTPGHGFSDMPEASVSPPVLFEGILSCLDQLPCAPFVIVGNSLGGGMTLRYTLTRPERVQRVIAMSPAGAPTSDEERPAFLSRFDIEARKDAHDFIDRLFYQAPWYRPLIASVIRANFQRPTLKQFLGSVRDGIDDDEYLFKPDELASYAQPLLMIWGQADRIMPASHLPYFKAHMPTHTQWIEPPNAGHSPQIERPIEMAQAILQFLTKEPPSA